MPRIELGDRSDLLIGERRSYLTLATLSAAAVWFAQLIWREQQTRVASPLGLGEQAFHLASHTHGYWLVLSWQASMLFLVSAGAVWIAWSETIDQNRNLHLVRVLARLGAAIRRPPGR